MSGDTSGAFIAIGAIVGGIFIIILVGYCCYSASRTRETDAAEEEARKRKAEEDRVERRRERMARASEEFFRNHPIVNDEIPRRERTAATGNRTVEDEAEDGIEMGSPEVSAPIMMPGAQPFGGVVIGRVVGQ